MVELTLSRVDKGGAGSNVGTKGPKVKPRNRGTAQTAAAAPPLSTLQKFPKENETEPVDQETVAPSVSSSSSSTFYPQSSTISILPHTKSVSGSQDSPQTRHQDDGNADEEYRGTNDHEEEGEPSSIIQPRPTALVHAGNAISIPQSKAILVASVTSKWHRATGGDAEEEADEEDDNDEHGEPKSVHGMSIKEIIASAFSQGKLSAAEEARLAKMHAQKEAKRLLLAAAEQDADTSSERVGARPANSQAPETAAPPPVEPLANSLPHMAPVAGPRLRMVNGQILLDEASLVVQQTNPEDDADEMQRVEEEAIRYVTSATFQRKKTPKSKWNDESTALFYQGLSHFGTDFHLISMMIPGKTRNQIKAKFSAEEKNDSARITKALMTKVDPAKKLKEAMVESSKVMKPEVNLSTLEISLARAEADDAEASADADNANSDPADNAGTILNDPSAPASLQESTSRHQAGSSMRIRGGESAPPPLKLPQHVIPAAPAPIPLPLPSLIKNSRSTAVAGKFMPKTVQTPGELQEMSLLQSPAENMAKDLKWSRLQELYSKLLTDPGRVKQVEIEDWWTTLNFDSTLTSDIPSVYYQNILDTILHVNYSNYTEWKAHIILPLFRTLDRRTARSEWTLSLWRLLLGSTPVNDTRRSNSMHICLLTFYYCYISRPVKSELLVQNSDLDPVLEDLVLNLTDENAKRDLFAVLMHLKHGHGVHLFLQIHICRVSSTHSYAVAIMQQLCGEIDLVNMNQLVDKLLELPVSELPFERTIFPLHLCDVIILNLDSKFKLSLLQTFLLPSLLNPFAKVRIAASKILIKRVSKVHLPQQTFTSIIDQLQAMALYCAQEAKIFKMIPSASIWAVLSSLHPDGVQLLLNRLVEYQGQSFSAIAVRIYPFLEGLNGVMTSSGGQNADLLAPLHDQFYEWITMYENALSSLPAAEEDVDLGDPVHLVATTHSVAWRAILALYSILALFPEKSQKNEVSENYYESLIARILKTLQTTRHWGLANGVQTLLTNCLHVCQVQHKDIIRSFKKTCFDLVSTEESCCRLDHRYNYLPRIFSSLINGADLRTDECQFITNSLCELLVSDPSIYNPTTASNSSTVLATFLKQRKTKNLINVTEIIKRLLEMGRCVQVFNLPSANILFSTCLNFLCVSGKNFQKAGKCSMSIFTSLFEEVKRCFSLGESLGRVTVLSLVLMKRMIYAFTNEMESIMFPVDLLVTELHALCTTSKIDTVRRLASDCFVQMVKSHDMSYTLSSTLCNLSAITTADSFSNNAAHGLLLILIKLGNRMKANEGHLMGETDIGIMKCIGQHFNGDQISVAPIVRSTWLQFSSLPL